MSLQGRNDAYSEGEIVVALKHIKLVRNELEPYMKVVKRSEDDDAELGLGRIAFKSEKELHNAVKAFKKYDPDAGAQNTYAADPLDSLLRGIRGYFRKQNSGWAPLLGKNRLVGVGVGNRGIVGGGGGGPLRLVDPLRNRPRAALGSTGFGVRVGVLDTEIYPNAWYAGGWNSRVVDELKLAKRNDGRKKLPAAAGHATFVTGVVLQQAPAATVIARSVLNVKGEATSWNVAKAIVELARTRPQVMNLSFQCFTEDAGPPLVLKTAIDKVDTDTVIVASAGNHRPEAHPSFDRPAWPAGFDRVVAVGSADNENHPSTFAPQGHWVDAYVPGEDVHSTFIEGRLDVDLDVDPELRDEDADYRGFASWSGSSFAAAKLSGAIAARTKVGSKSPREALGNLLTGAPSMADLQINQTHARMLGSPPLNRYFDHRSN